MSKALSKSSLALLRVAKDRLALSEDVYRAILENYGGSRSATGLDDRGFAAVMDRFRALGFTSDRRTGSYGRRFGMATDAQLDLIRSLWRELSSDPTERRLSRWLSDYHKVSALRFLDSAKAAKVIAALKAWKARGSRHV